MSIDDLVNVKWRVGRKVGRTIYAAIGTREEDDPLIGVMDTPEMASSAVLSHNEWVRLFGGFGL